MFRLLLNLTFSVILLSGCRQVKDPVLNLQLHRTDFVEKIRVAGTIQAVNTQTIIVPKVYSSEMKVMYLAENGAYVKKGDTICILDAPMVFDYYERLITNLDILKADMKKMEADNTLKLSELEAGIEINEAKILQYSLDSIQQKFAPPVKQKLFALELEKANIEKVKLRKKYNVQKKIADAELRSMKSRIMQSENQIKLISDQISSLTVLAPRDGLTMHMVTPELRFIGSSGAGTIGGRIEINSSVFSSMGLLQMPDISLLQVLAEVSETDYKRIEPGQKVHIRVSAVKDLQTTGVVKRKALAGKTGKNQPSVKTYEVIISIDSCHSKMKPGLGAICEVIINEVKDTVVVPSMAIFEEDSSRIIYVLNNKKYVPTIISTGSANSSETIVSKGLNGDEVIALMEPPHRWIEQRKKETGESMHESDTLTSDTLANDIH